MTSSSPSYASLSTLLTSIQAHLSPRPLLNALPTALQLLAQIQLVSGQVKVEAARALREHDNLSRRLEERGIVEEEWVRYGALSKKEGRRLKRMTERDEGGKMMGFSLEFRKHHIARLCTVDVGPNHIASLMDNYFPDLSNSSIDQRSHKMLFIRIMPPEETKLMLVYRDKVRVWYDMVVSSIQEKRSRPRWKDLEPNATTDRADVLARNILKMADEVMRDVQDLEDMFKTGEQGVVDLVKPSNERGPNSSPMAIKQSMSSPIEGPSAVQEPAPSRQYAPSPPMVNYNYIPPVESAHPSPNHPTLKQSPHTPSSPPKKRRRRSGLPPLSGPDYFAPYPTSSSSGPGKPKLRPFDNGKLQRAGQMKRSRLSNGETMDVSDGDGDENDLKKPRTVKREGNREVLVDVGSQESSLESKN